MTTPSPAPQWAKDAFAELKQGLYIDRTVSTTTEEEAAIRIITKHAAAISEENRQLREALKPFAQVAGEYDKNCLDECRPEWNGANDESVEILTGRGGKPLLSLHHFLTARTALSSNGK